MDFPPAADPRPVLRIGKQLEARLRTWCVGGRSANLLKVENHDFDLTTAAPPDEVRRVQAHGAGGHRARHRRGARPAEPPARGHDVSARTQD